MKHFCLFMLALILLLGAFSFANGEENKINCSSGKYLYNINDDGTAVIVGYTGWDLSLVIPDRLKGHPVVSIGEEAFSDRDTLTVVTIPDSITSIDHAAFSDCDSQFVGMCRQWAKERLFFGKSCSPAAVPLLKWFVVKALQAIPNGLIQLLQ